MVTKWDIQLFGGLRVEREEHVITHFQTRKAGALFAYLAYYLHQQHPREVLVELLWPEGDLEAGRNSLSVALSALRHQLEPRGVPSGAVILADRFHVQLNVAYVTTDVAAFESALDAAARAEGEADRIQFLEEAAERYKGPLLPGHYETWVAPEQERLAERLYESLFQLIAMLQQRGDLASALRHARRAVGLDPLREDAQRELMRLYAEAGQTATALRQYQELERALNQELGAAPSAATRTLAEQLRRNTRTGGDRPETMMADRPGAGTTRPADRPASDTSGSTLDLAPAMRIPVSLTHFFGRKEETARIHAMLRSASTRLVTLSGPGGSGKTRLAIEVAGQLTEAFHAAVWFVSFADIVDPHLIIDKIFHSLGLAPSSSRSALEQIIEAISSQPALLVLDNFEQLVDGGAPILQSLVERTRALKCLVTSRQRLNLAGEREIPILPLPTPSAGSAATAPGSRITADQVMLSESCQLFVDRARAVRPDFGVTDENAADLATLCRRLEGIPLAIELAAARANVLTPAQMVTQLRDRFSFLVSRRRDVEPRHRTLRSALDWSYQLLPVELQQFFTRLSVFRGGWTIEAAQAICLTERDEDGQDRVARHNGGHEGPDTLDSSPLALDYLAQLKECSLVLVEENASVMRFRMLDTLREYATERLAAEERSALQRRHSQWFLTLAEEAEPHLRGPEQGRWLDRLETEYDNLRAALEWCEQEAAGEAGLRFVGALWPFWTTRGYFAEGYGWTERALARGGSPCVRARALLGASELVYFLGEYGRSEAMLREALALFRDVNDRRGIAQALLGLGLAVCAQSGFSSGQALMEESLSLFRELGDAWGAAMSLNNLGDMQTDYALARSLQEESLALSRELGDTQGVAFALEGLGRAAWRVGDLVTARAHFEESLALFRQLRHTWASAVLVSRLGDMAAAQCDYATAYSLHEESLETFRNMGNRWGVALALSRLGDVAIERGEYPSARAFLEESLAISNSGGYKLAAAHLLGCLGIVVNKQGDGPAARSFFEQSLSIWEEVGYKPGIALGLENMASLARREGDAVHANALYRRSIAIYQEIGNSRGIASCLEGLAAGDPSDAPGERAAQLYGSAEALREAISYVLRPSERDDYDSRVEEIRAALGNEAFSAAWAAGRALPLDQALALALEEA